MAKFAKYAFLLLVCLALLPQETEGRGLIKTVKGIFSWKKKSTKDKPSQDKLVVVDKPNDQPKLKEQKPKLKEQKPKLKEQQHKEQQHKHKEQQQHKHKEQQKPKLNKDKGEFSHLEAPSYRTKYFQKVPAGASMGNGDGYYYTLGAHLCSADDTVVYGLTNGHNQHSARKDADVLQPSNHDTDEDSKSRAVAKWTGIKGTDPWMDVALMTFTKQSHAAVGKVLGPNGKLLTVKGIVTNDEIRQWPTDDSKVLYLSGRMAGWSGVVYQGFGLYMAELIDGAWSDVIKVSALTTVGSDSWTIMTGGNSGSGLWELDPNGDDVKLVGLFNNGPLIIPIEDVLGWIHDKKGGAGIKVCTA